MLEKIKEKELLFSGDIEDDRTNTYLHLLDYDWMNYILETRFKTEKQGVLDIKFEYCGITTSHMQVTQTINGKTKEYTINYPTSIFEKYIKKYLRRHIRQWNDRYAFYGGDIVLAFYNSVIKYQEK